MDFMLLTQNATPIFKYVVMLLGFIMNVIFEFLNLIGIPNVGLSIILFIIVIYPGNGETAAVFKAFCQNESGITSYP